MSNPIFFEDDAVIALNQFLSHKNHSKLFVLVDENTHSFCLQSFLSLIAFDKTIEIIEIESGEIHKNIETVVEIWQILSDYQADRHALMINLGGGVITDLGGFVASTYKRGIDFVQVPTTLLSMVDAAIGGKNGIDLGFLKNQVGTITRPQLVLILPTFLNTLDKRQWRSGLAEMLKHGLIYSKNHWNKLKNLENLTIEDLSFLIKESAEIKSTIVSKDPNEQGLRKILNFGHTLGHAIESYALENESIEPLLHGEAIATGMILEAHISFQMGYLLKEDFNEIYVVLAKYFEKPKFELSFEKLENYMLNDKKNRDGQLKFVLLYEIGQADYDKKVDKNMIIKSLGFIKK